MSILILLQEVEKIDLFRPGTDLYRVLLAARQDYNSLLDSLRDLRRLEKNRGRAADDLLNQIDRLGKKSDLADQKCTDAKKSKDQKIDNLQLSYGHSRDGLKQIKAMHKNVAGLCPICNVDKCATFTLADTILSADPDNPGGA